MTLRLPPAWERILMLSLEPESEGQSHHRSGKMSDGTDLGVSRMTGEYVGESQRSGEAAVGSKSTG